jgi:hypothetical protein
MDDKRLRHLALEAGLKDTIEDVAYMAYLQDLDRFANLLLSMGKGLGMQDYRHGTDPKNGS